jgi:hypothetical protein
VKHLCGGLVVAWSVAIHAFAHAQPTTGREPPTARLVYADGGRPAECPDEVSFRDAVVARLGRAPFGAEEPTVVVRLSRVGGGFRGEWLIDSPRGEPGPRRIEAARCSDVVEAMALAIAVAFEPPPEEEASPPPAPPPSPPATPRREPTRAPPPPVSTERDVRSSSAGPSPRVDLGVGASIVSPTPAAPIGRIGAALAWESFALGIEGQAQLPVAAAEAAGGDVVLSFASAGVAPCLQPVTVFAACAIGRIGSLRGLSSGPGGGEDISLYATVGARLEGIARLAPWFSAVVQVDAGATLTPTSFHLAGDRVYETPTVGIEVVLTARATLRASETED